MLGIPRNIALNFPRTGTPRCIAGLKRALAIQALSEESYTPAALPVTRKVSMSGRPVESIHTSTDISNCPAVRLVGESKIGISLLVIRGGV